MPLLRGTDGEAKMSKSYDNYIGITEPAEQMFGKTMSIPDTLLEEWYELGAGATLDDALRQRVTDEPYKAKRELGRRIVAMYHGDGAADAAEAHFDRLFKEHAAPDEIPEVEVSVADARVKFGDGSAWVPGVLVAAGMASSNSEAMRLIEQGAIAADEVKIADRNGRISAAAATAVTLRRGKRQYVRVRFVD
jgi:tyrosyl-tRNA synthetase